MLLRATSTGVYKGSRVRSGQVFEISDKDAAGQFRLKEDPENPGCTYRARWVEDVEEGKEEEAKEESRSKAKQKLSENRLKRDVI